MELARLSFMTIVCMYFTCNTHCFRFTSFCPDMYQGRVFLETGCPTSLSVHHFLQTRYEIPKKIVINNHEHRCRAHMSLY